MKQPTKALLWWANCIDLHTLSGFGISVAEGCLDFRKRERTKLPNIDPFLIYFPMSRNDIIEVMGDVPLPSIKIGYPHVTTLRSTVTGAANIAMETDLLDTSAP